MIKNLKSSSRTDKATQRTPVPNTQPPKNIKSKHNQMSSTQQPQQEQCVFEETGNAK